MQAVEKLLDAGADPNLAGRNRLPPLHLAAMLGSLELVERLIVAGASIQASDFVNFTALHCATYFAHEKVCGRWMSVHTAFV